MIERLPDLQPFGLLAGDDDRGWVVVDAEAYRLVEPAAFWTTRESAIAFARAEYERRRIEDAAYRQRTEEPVRQALERGWEAVKRRMQRNGMTIDGPRR